MSFGGWNANILKASVSPHEQLQRNEDADHPQTQREGAAGELQMPALEQVPGSGPRHEQGRRQEHAQQRVRKVVQKGRAENGSDPVGGTELPVDERIACKRQGNSGSPQNLGNNACLLP